jgi:rhomboid protease GluP
MQPRSPEPASPDAPRQEPLGGTGQSAPAEPSRAVVHRSAEPRTCRDALLVLEAAGIPAELISAPPELWVATSLEDAPRARRELVAYLRENRVRTIELPFEPVSDGRTGALLAAALLGLFFLVERSALFGQPWYEAGLMDAARVRSGELWRAATALTLHADLGHLASNVLFGGVFLWLLSQLLGSGLAFAATGLAGLLGNLLNAWAHPLPHRSIGASTAVFAALGLLVGAEFLRRSAGPRGQLRRYAPPILGLFLLGWLGTGGESGSGRVDVLAHALGFLAGLALSPPVMALGLRVGLGSPRLQAIAPALAVGGLCLAWLLALWNA